MHADKGHSVIRLVNGSLLMDGFSLCVDREVGVIRDDDRWGSSGNSGAGDTVFGEVFFDKDLFSPLVNKVLSVTEQSERGHDDAEVERDGEELTVVWRVEALARD